MKRMYLDLETLPATEDKHDVLRYLHAKRQAKKAKKENGEPVDFEHFLLGTSFDGSFGRILVAAYAIDDNPVEALCEVENEAELLKDFWKLASDVDLFVGHNIIDFDMRFIYQRSMVHNIKPSRNLNFARYRDNPMYDTMREWTHWGGGSIGLEHIAMAMDLPSPKDGIDGSQVYDFFKKGKIDEIVEYCKRDVETTRSVYKRMTFSV